MFMSLTSNPAHENLCFKEIIHWNTKCSLNNSVHRDILYSREHVEEINSSTIGAG